MSSDVRTADVNGRNGSAKAKTVPAQAELPTEQPTPESTSGSTPESTPESTPGPTSEPNSGSTPEPSVEDAIAAAVASVQASPAADRGPVAAVVRKLPTRSTRLARAQAGGAVSTSQTTSRTTGRSGGAGRKEGKGRKDPMAMGLSVITKLSQSPLLDRYNLRPRAEKAAFHVTKTAMSTAAAASRTFASVNGSANGKAADPQRQSRPEASDLFDLTPGEEQAMIVDVVREFAQDQLRPAADQADRDCVTPDELVATAVELGVWQLAVPESLGGFSGERSAVTGVLVAEALAQGDLGLAVGILAPSAVSTTLSLWGSAKQQSTYLPAFTAENPPRAAFALMEPQPVFDPFQLATTARKVAGGYVLDGVKSLVPGASRAELFVVAADVEGEGPALFVLESSTAGLAVTAEPAMGLRAAQTGRLTLTGVAVPERGRIGSVEDNPYAEAVRLSRIGWCALAVGTAQAVVDYVIPYVNGREAFGEPVSHRQGVAFTVADMATELAGMRLATYRAASRAEQGLDFRRETALARRLCSDFGMAIGSDGVQMLGGHGFVRDHPVERWYRDLRSVGLMEGVVLV